MGPMFFLVGISWVPNFFTWVFRGSEIVFRGYFVGPNFFLVAISRVQNSSCGCFVGTSLIHEFT